MQKTLKSEEVEKLNLHLEYLFQYGVNFKERTILINPCKTDESGDISYEIAPETFSIVDAALTEMESYSRQAVTIKICSYGGSVKAAMAIVGRLQASKCKIITEGYGTIESAATLLLACGRERRVSKYATFMHHELSMGVEGRLTTIKAEVDQAEREERLWAKWMAEFSKKPAKFYLEQGKHTDKWWTPEQLLEFGLVDKII